MKKFLSVLTAAFICFSVFTLAACSNKDSNTAQVTKVKPGEAIVLDLFKAETKIITVDEYIRANGVEGVVYSASSDNLRVAKVTPITGGKFTVTTAKATGSCVITLKASVAQKAVVTVTFNTSVIDSRPAFGADPYVLKEGTEVRLNINTSPAKKIDIAEYIDENGTSDITYTVSGANSSVGYSDIKDGSFSITALALGEAVITLNALKGSSVRAAVTFAVTVTDAAPADDINLLKNTKDDEWKDYNENDQTADNEYMGFKSFELSGGDNALNPIKSRKYHEYDYIYKNVGKYASQLTDYKKLVMNVALSENLSEPVELIMKVESSPRIAGGTGFRELSIKLDSTTPIIVEFEFFDTYQPVLAGMLSIMLYPNAGTVGNFDGTRVDTTLPDLHITRFAFSKEEPNPEFVMNEKAAQLERPNEFESELPEDPFNINQNFISHDGDKAYKVSWFEGITYVTIADSKPIWAYLNSPVLGNLRAYGFNQLYIKYKGTPGVKIRLKLEGFGGNVETNDPAEHPEWSPDPEVCDNTIQEYTWTGFGPEHLSDGQQMMVLIFINGDETGATCGGFKLEILEFQFRKV